MNRVDHKYYKESSGSTEQLLETYSYAILSGGNTQKTTNTYIDATNYLTEITTYDYAGRELSTQNADGTTTSTAYNSNGTVNTTTDESGNVTYNKYDGLNRLVGTWTPVLSGSYSYTGYEFESNLVDKQGRTNIQRMEQGLAPIGSDGKSVNIHHIDQTNNGPVMEITATEHQQNYSSLHTNTGESASLIDRNAFDSWRKEYWQWRSKNLD